MVAHLIPVAVFQTRSAQVKPMAIVITMDWIKQRGNDNILYIRLIYQLGKA